MSEPAVTPPVTPEPAVTMIYTLTIGVRGHDDAVSVYTTLAARKAALDEHVKDNWDEYFDEDLPDDLDEAADRLHQETDLSWDLDEGPLQGPPLPAVALIARLRILLMGTMDDPDDLLEAINEQLFTYPGLPEDRAIRMANGDLADWRALSDAWDTLRTTDPDTLPTPDTIQAYLVGDGNSETDLNAWLTAHLGEAENQGWTIGGEHTRSGLLILPVGEIFSTNQEALAYVQRQAQRRQRAAVKALELIDRDQAQRRHRVAR
jgi:hypothetical protein